MVLRSRARPDEELRQEQPYGKARKEGAAEAQGECPVSVRHSLRGVGFETVLWEPD